MSVEQGNLNSYFLLPLFCCHYSIIKDILTVDCLYYWLEPLFVYVKNKLFFMWPDFSFPPLEANADNGI